MTSKRELKRLLEESSARYTRVSDTLYDERAQYLTKEYKLLAASKQGDAAQRSLVEGFQRQTKSLVGLLDDILVIEPQLKHLLTHGVWDFERVHRAAEHLRGEDALESVGYTTQCEPCGLPDNVHPLFPTDPSESGRGAA